MSSVSSLVTTAASDVSSSADSPYCKSGRSARRSPPAQPRRRSYNLKARGVVIAKESAGGGKQKVFCVCSICKVKTKMVSMSTCYRHLRIEAEIAEDDAKWEARWGTHPQTASTTSQEEHWPVNDIVVAKHAAGAKLGFGANQHPRVVRLGV